VELRGSAMDALPKLVTFAKPVHEKAIRSLIEFVVEKGPDFVRAASVTSIIALNDVEKTTAGGLLKMLCGLQDWRVRYMVCNNIDKVGRRFHLRSERSSAPVSSEASFSKTTPIIS
jgi:hypothetical protein